LHELGGSSMVSMRYRTDAGMGRILIFPVSEEVQNSEFPYLHRAIRAHLEGPLLRQVKHLAKADAGAPIAIRRDGTIVRKNGGLLLPDGTKVGPGDSAIKFLKDMSFDGSERTMSNPILVIPDGTVLLPGGRLLDPTGRDITPASQRIDDQFPVLLEGSLYRTEVHMTPAKAPKGMVIRTFGSSPQPDGSKLLVDGRRLRPDNQVVAADGTVLGTAEIQD
ncbi:MAG TPA: hypothetical protein VGC54_13495, partial [Planctomycetota bacterium]